MSHHLQYTCASRLDAWIRHMKLAKPCHTQQMAYELVIDSWVQTNAELGASQEFLKALRRRRLCEEHGWRGVNTSVAHWDLDDEHTVRIYLHEDGSIVVQQMDSQNLQILFTLPGHRERLGEVSERCA